MSSLKEVKTRVVSVQTTRKITQARQMISSAQLHRAQGILAGALAYRGGLEEVFAQVAGTIDQFSPWYATGLRPGKKGGVAVVVFSADGGMCGAFNSHIIKEMHAIAQQYGDDARFFIIGKKARVDASKERYALGGGNDHGEPTPSREQSELAQGLPRREGGGRSQLVGAALRTDRQSEGRNADSEIAVASAHTEARREGLNGYRDIDNVFRTPVGKVTVEQVAALASELIGGFLSGRFSRVEVLFSEFLTVATQRVRHRVLLPLARTGTTGTVAAPGAATAATGTVASATPAPKTASPSAPAKDYIMEPSAGEMVEGLVPMLVAAQINAALANSITSEHAARMTAMQLATENADQLLDELQLMYNKLRQQNITSELLDIIGSSFA